MLLGDVLLRLGDVAGARAAYRQALARGPSDVATLLSLARLEIREGGPNEGRAWLERALLIDPNSLDAHQLLADALTESGDLEAAVEHLWRARRPDSGRPAAIDYRARLLDLYDRLAERERAGG